MLCLFGVDYKNSSLLAFYFVINIKLFSVIDYNFNPILIFLFALNKIFTKFALLNTPKWQFDVYKLNR